MTVNEDYPNIDIDANGDRPRERMISRGVTTLSDRDLLAAILGSGNSSGSVYALSDRVLAVLEEHNFRPSFENLLEISGMGVAKSALVTAAIELGRRIVAPREYRIRYPVDVIPLLQHYADRSQEHFLCISLNGAHEVLGIHIVSVGLVNRTLVHPREVFVHALTERAAAVIIAHNHPSGNVEPSQEDHAVTRNLVEAGEIVGVRVLDHIIFSVRGHYSYLETGML